jgi:hypothetical protein
MADETASPPPEAPEYPPPGLPVIYSDGVPSASWGAEVVKFYLARNDPDFRASAAPRKQNIYAQVVMPLNSFLQSTAFFDSILDRMVREGTLTAEQVATARAKNAD